MKKLLIMLSVLVIALAVTVIPVTGRTVQAAITDSIVDNANDTSLLATDSVNVRRTPHDTEPYEEGDNQEVIGDDYRFRRVGSNDELAYLGYNIPAGANAVIVTVYEDVGAKFSDIVMAVRRQNNAWVSTDPAYSKVGSAVDNISDFTVRVEEGRAAAEGQAKLWTKKTYTLKLPVNSRFLRVYFTADTEAYNGAEQWMQQVGSVRLAKGDVTAAITEATAQVNDKSVTVTGTGVQDAEVTVALVTEGLEVLQTKVTVADSDGEFGVSFSGLPDGIYRALIYQTADNSLPGVVFRGITYFVIGERVASQPSILRASHYGDDMGKETRVLVSGVVDVFFDVEVTVYGQSGGFTKTELANVNNSTGAYLAYVSVGASGTYLVKVRAVREGFEPSGEVAATNTVTLDITNVADDTNKNYTSYYEARPSSTPLIYCDDQNPQYFDDNYRYLFTEYGDGQYIKYKSDGVKTHSTIIAYFEFTQFMDNPEQYSITPEMIARMEPELKEQGYLDFDFYVSDNNINWRKVNFSKTEIIPDGMWTKVTYELNYEDSEYLMIVFNQSFKDFPELYNISYGPYSTQLGYVSMDNRSTGEADTEDAPYMTPDAKDDPTEVDNIVDDGKGKKLPVGLIIGVSAAAVAVVAGGLTGLVLVRKRRNK